MRNSTQILEYLTANHNISESIIDDVYAYAKVCSDKMPFLKFPSFRTKSATIKSVSTGSENSFNWRRQTTPTRSTPFGAGSPPQFAAANTIRRMRA